MWEEGGGKDGWIPDAGSGLGCSEGLKPSVLCQSEPDHSPQCVITRVENFIIF